MDHKILFDEIKYLESYGDLIKIHLDRGMLLVAKTMIALETMPPTELLQRVHRSFIVSPNRIEAISGNGVAIDGVRIPVGRSHGREVARVVERRLRRTR